MIGTELVRRLAEVFREPLHEAHIVPDRSRRIVTTLEFLEQHLAKVGHSNVPPVTHTLSRPHNYSVATTVATAAPAASFSPADLKLSNAFSVSCLRFGDAVAECEEDISRLH